MAGLGRLSGERRGDRPGRWDGMRVQCELGCVSPRDIRVACPSRSNDSDRRVQYELGCIGPARISESPIRVAWAVSGGGYALRVLVARRCRRAAEPSAYAG